MLTSSPKFNGEPTAQAMASGLATLGRHGDEYMVHAAHGETMIPKEVFEANPRLKDDLLWQMKMMGIKDPNRFVVGNAMNSINPITGLPEFWFHKKAWKAVKKIVKKIAPIVAPILGNMIMPGIGGLIASGLVTKLQGGSWGDVLKGAAIGVVTQGLTSGIGSVAGGGSFLSGVGRGLSSPFQAGSNLFSSGAANPFNQGIFGSAGVFKTGLNALGQKASLFDYAAPSYNPNAQFAANMPAGIAAAGGTTVTSPQGQPNQIEYSPAGGSQYGPRSTASVVPSADQQANYLRDVEMQSAFGFPDETYNLQNVNVNDAPGLANLKRYSNLGPTSMLERGELGPRLTFDPKTGTFVNAPVSEYPQNEIITVGGEQFQNVPKADTIGIDPKTGIPTVSDLGTSGFKPYNDPGALDFGLTGMAEEGLAPILGSETAKTVASYTPYATTAAVVGAGAAAASAAGWFEEEDIPDEKEDPLRFDDYDKWRGMEDKNSPAAIALYRKWYGQPYVTRSDYEAQIGGPDTSKPDWWFIPEGAAAQTREGFGAVPSIPGQQASIGSILGQQAGIGSVLSQRAQPIQLTANRGGEVMGPGTGTSDSIPARLSDGEFVMTANAVRNAGNGNRDVGAARMYDMMRRFEGGTA
jgi:hypothetical protein